MVAYHVSLDYLIKGKVETSSECSMEEGKDSEDDEEAEIEERKLWMKVQKT